MPPDWAHLDTRFEQKEQVLAVLLA